MKRLHQALLCATLLVAAPTVSASASINSESPDQWGTNNLSGSHSCTFPMNVTEVGNLTTEAYGFVTHIAPGGEFRQQFQNYNSFQVNYSHAKSAFNKETIWGGGPWEMTSHGYRYATPDCQSFG